MKHLYDVTQGQLIAAWVFGIVLVLFHLSPAFDYGRQWAIFMVVFVPFLLVFYTIGWWSRRKKN